MFMAGCRDVSHHVKQRHCNKLEIKHDLGLVLCGYFCVTVYDSNMKYFCIIPTLITLFLLTQNLRGFGPTAIISNYYFISYCGCFLSIAGLCLKPTIVVGWKLLSNSCQGALDLILYVVCDIKKE